MLFLNKTRWFVLLGLLLLSAPNLAAPLFIGSDIAYQLHEDPTDELDFDGFIQLVKNGGLETHQQSLSKGYVRETFWLYWSIPGHHFVNQEQLLMVTPNFLDAVNIYYRPLGDPNAVWVKREAGDLTAGIRGDLDYRFPVYKIPQISSPHLGYEFVVRIKTTSTVIFEASLWQPEAFIEHMAKQTSYLSFYLGVAALSTFLAIILAFIIRSKLLIATVGYSTVYILIASIQGYITWLFPNENFPYQHYITNFFSYISYAFLIWVSAEALDLKKHLPNVYAFMLLVMIVIVIQSMAVPLNKYGEGFVFLGSLYLLTALVFLVSFFYVMHKEKYKPIKILIGLSPFICFLASFLSLIILLGWVSYDRRVYLVWQYAPIFNTLLVIVLAVIRSYEEKSLRHENLLMTRELQIEREAGFHQRQFMGMLSHEFRTPLSVISMAMQNLHLIPQQNPQVSQRYQRIQKAVDRLVQLTDNCLADSRISAKALHLEKELTSWGQLLKESCSLASLSEQHELRVTFEGKVSSFNALKNHSVEVDKALLQIALSNLLDNAVKYTREGEILVNLSRSNKQYILTIKDQGGGIAPEKVEFLFDRYQRSLTQNSKRSTSTKGYGLGLYVALQITQAHGGDLQLIQNTPHGCTFQLSLPITKKSAK